MDSSDLRLALPLPDEGLLLSRELAHAIGNGRVHRDNLEDSLLQASKTRNVALRLAECGRVNALGSRGARRL